MLKLKKEKDIKPAEESGDKYHGVSKFNVELLGSKLNQSGLNVPTYTKVFAEYT